MAEDTSIPDGPSPEQSDDGAPKKRVRRRAGAPTGAPAAAPAVEDVTPAAPVTSVAAQSDAPIFESPAPASTRRRRAGAPAGAPSLAAETPPQAASPSAPEPVAEDAKQDEDPQDAGTTPEDAGAEKAIDGKNVDATDSSRASGSGIVADLEALATARGASGSDRSEDRPGRSAQAQMDFASLLFQAPAPVAPRTTVGPSDSDSEDEEQPEDSAETQGAEEQESGSRGSRRSRSRRSRSRAPQDDAREEDDASSEDDADTSTDDRSEGDDSEDDGGSSRRRRRRGGRGRRGRGRGDDEQDDSEDDTSSDEKNDDEAEDSRRSSRRSSSRRRGRGSAETEGSEESGDQDDQSSDQDDSDDAGEESSGSSSSRRRRRRRRSGGSGSSDDSSDDPPNTVVKVREARDEVRSVKGSTRLEAKKQRRREGRDAGRRRSVVSEAEFLARRESVKRSMVVRERPGRVQIAVLEDDILVEHYVAQKAQTSMVGNVYLGKVQNVLPSMEAAFVDIGKGRNAVLYAGEVNWDAVGLEGQPRRIELALKSGDPVLVQVTKDPIGHKGARLSSQISLPGRYVVFVPGGSMAGISRKLPDSERSRLKKIMREAIPEGAGVIVRTAAEGASEEELTKDVARLRAQWDTIQKAQKSKSAPVALSQEPDLAIKVVRDVFNEDFTSLIVQGDKVYDDVHEYVASVAPDLLERLTRHIGDKDVFTKHRIDEQLLKAMDRKVYLPSGGSLVIDRTEAMTVVDVNTGKFTGSGGSLEETVTRNNLEAAEEIVRQLRLRDIGGIIVVDFIDMVLEANRDLVLRRLVECLGRDRTKHQVAEVTSLGLVQMTRKRVSQGLVETFSSTCESCNGRGMTIDIDGAGHVHEERDEESGSRRKGNGRKGRGGKGGSAQESPSDSGDPEGGDVHRLEDDENSRALARATIASIAAASSNQSQPEVTVDGQVVSLGDAPQAEPSEATGSSEAPSDAVESADVSAGTDAPAADTSASVDTTQVEESAPVEEPAPAPKRSRSRSRRATRGAAAASSKDSSSPQEQGSDEAPSAEQVAASE